ncbi:probable glucuronosyltransferase at C-terminar half [Coccomyxa sp. Obi]|nr:probable glucuronosyltransferase at C-terminar half [Coccomyxa sp. Obi]
MHAGMIMSWTHQHGVIVGALLWGLVAASATAAQEKDDAAATAAYQEQLFQKTMSLHPKQHSFSGHSGPWLENVFYDAWISLKPRTSRIFVPVAWTDAMHVSTLKLHMQQVLNQLNPKFKYFTVVQAGHGFKHPKLALYVPSHIDFILFSAGGDSPPLKTVPVPLLKEELRPVGLAKSITASSQCEIGNHGVRRALQARYNSSYLFLAQSDDWRTITESSNFSFCPRGYGPTSFRLYETLQLGTIPIYVWEEEKWLAFEDRVNWEEIAIVVESHDIDRIDSRIAKADVDSMKAAVVKHRHLFTYEFTIQYILDSVTEDREGIPVLHPVKKQAGAALRTRRLGSRRGNVALT